MTRADRILQMLWNRLLRSESLWKRVNISTYGIRTLQDVDDIFETTTKLKGKEYTVYLSRKLVAYGFSEGVHCNWCSLLFTLDGVPVEELGQDQFRENELADFAERVSISIAERNTREFHSLVS